MANRNEEKEKQKEPASINKAEGAALDKAYEASQAGHMDPEALVVPEGPSLATLMLQLAEVARGGSMDCCKATLREIMPTELEESQKWVAMFARMKSAMEQLHSLSMEIAFQRRG